MSCKLFQWPEDLTNGQIKEKLKSLENTGGIEQVIKVNYNKIISGEHPELNIPLHPGDSIVVP